jgi:formylglycine-generating enzyme required for sulfatase activity
MPQAHGNALPEGYRLHWYRIDGVLGRGGFGITYLALDTTLERQVAIKEYLPVTLAVRESDSRVRPFTEERKQTYLWGLERFIDEGQILTRFQHPNIVRVLAAFRANDTAYMVMEYEPGTSLDDLFKFGHVDDEASLLRIAHPVLDGLEHVHDAGFIHRDLKPANIHLRDDGSPVLLDFGSARIALESRTRGLTGVVSAGFSPFEQYDTEDWHQGPWTDIYGLGATLYAALDHGRAPVDAVSRGNALLEGRPDPLAPAAQLARGRYSARFLGAIDAALSFKPADRPQSIAAWRTMFPALERAPEPDSVPTEVAVRDQPARSGVSTPGSRTGRRATIAAIVVAAVVAGLLVATHRRDEPAMDTDVAGPAGPPEIERGTGRADAGVGTAGRDTRTATGARRDSAASEAAPATRRADEMEAPSPPVPGVPSAPGAPLETGRETTLRDTLADGSPGPELVRIRAGRVDVARSPREAARAVAAGSPAGSGVARDFALGRFEVTTEQYRRFVESTGYVTVAEKTGGCATARGRRDGASWRDPGFRHSPGGRHPVVCVAWQDAVAYTDWLSEQTGARYRLPSEVEWEHAARAGTVGPRFWGDEPADACRHANVGDAARAARGGPIAGTPHPCSDGAPGPAPTGRFDANALGVHDMLGNVWEWTSDCWRESPVDPAGDGTAATRADCSRHARRGGSFVSGVEEIRASARKAGRPPAVAVGFRVARDL